jgi:vacuolar-type H+-ATPase subunit H
MQVRKLLREIGEEVRARQRVRDDLHDEIDPRARAELEAEQIVARAEAAADGIVAEAQAQAAPADRSADEIVADAHREAERIIEEAEQAARNRTDVVLSEAQMRLDRLLDRERDLTARLRLAEQRLSELAVGEMTAGGRDLLAATTAIGRDDAEVLELTTDEKSDESFAAFMKAALRDEVGLDRSS